MIINTINNFVSYLLIRRIYLSVFRMTRCFYRVLFVIVTLFYFVLPDVAVAAKSSKEAVDELLRLTRNLMYDNQDSALLMAKKAFEISLNADDDTLIYRSNAAFAEIYFNHGNQLLAIEYFHKVLEILEKIPSEKLSLKDYTNFYSIYSKLGNCYFDVGNKKTARTFFLQSLKTLKIAKQKYPDAFNENDEVSLLFNLGAVYLSEKQLDSAKNIFDEVARINESLNDSTVHLYMLNNLGFYYKEKDMPDEAISTYYEALDIASQTNDLIITTKILYNLGNYYSLKKNYCAAHNYYTKAIQTGKRASEWPTVIMAADELASLYAIKNDYYNAYLTSRFAVKLKDSLYSDDRVAFHERLVVQYTFDKEMKTLELESKAKVGEQRRLKFLFLQISIGLLFLTGLSILYARSKNSKAKLAIIEKNFYELEAKRQKEHSEAMRLAFDSKAKELAEKAMHIVQKNEFIIALKKQLLSLSKSLPNDYGSKLNSIIAEIQRDTDDKIWQEFEYRFRDVHEDFYKALNARFPDLTPNEKKLAAFLRLNLTTKDIASITYQSPESIKVARSRLRKKMGLEQGENLVAVIESIV